jgi:hypothetical protein
LVGDAAVHLLLFACNDLQELRRGANVVSLANHRAWDFLCAIIAIIAIRKAGSCFALIMTLRILLWKGLVGLLGSSIFLVVTNHSGGSVIFVLVSCATAASFLSIGGFLQRDEKYAPRIGLALMVLAIPVFTLMSWRHSALEHGLIGGYLALLASIAFAHACFRWIRQPRLPKDVPPPMTAPTAIVVK